jgi:deoxyribose-phosphate aldolase
MAFGQQEAASSSVSVGESLYDGAERSMLRDKAQLCSQRWNAMVAKLEAALSKGQRQEAKSIIANYMGQLKSDMRLLSKAACAAGDIYVRTGVGISGNTACIIT